MSIDARTVKKLRAIVGKDHVIHHPEDLLVYEYDGSIDRATPSVVVFPASTDEVSRVVSLARDEGAPVVCRGSGTGLSGGAIASMGGVQVALTRMTRILEINTTDRIAIVEPGITNLDLDTQARKLGFRYAPDPSSQRACSIGGNVAENAGGPPLPGLRRDHQPHSWHGSCAGRRLGGLAGRRYCRRSRI